MTLDDFSATLSDGRPPISLDAPLAALWWDAKGEWDQAHACVMDDNSADAAWVHAYLHRREGDASNAAYWYRRAGKPVFSGSLSQEWSAMAQTLLARLTPPRS